MQPTSIKQATSILVGLSDTDCSLKEEQIISQEWFSKYADCKSKFSVQMMYYFTHSMLQRNGKL